MQSADFAAGFLACAFLVATLFFIRFWRRANDLLFLAFAAAFFLLALQQILMVFLNLPEEDRTWIYLLRLAAFGVLIIAILVKNLKR
jgi:Family of unknown function (DUF5985)